VTATACPDRVVGVTRVTCLGGSGCWFQTTAAGLGGGDCMKICMGVRLADCSYLGIRAVLLRALKVLDLMCLFSWRTVPTTVECCCSLFMTVLRFTHVCMDIIPSSLG
jgi:hypothetical protein